MPSRDILIETIKTRIQAISDCIANFEYARERLLKLQNSAQGSTGVQLDHALMKNQESIDSLRRDLAWEMQRLAKEEAAGKA